MAEEQTLTEEKKEESSVAEQAKPFDPATFPLKTILGRKVGMTQIFSESGERIPVSVIFSGSCFTTQIKTQSKDGYNAIQLGIGECKEKSLPKPYLAQFQKKNIPPLKWLKEFKVQNPEKFQVGQEVSVELFSKGDYVDVSGTSKGKGFAGVMKRHGFHGLPASHGASDKERSPGSSAGGSGQPQRVWKGIGGPGRMGSDWVTVQMLEVVKVDKENRLILVRGAVPGPIKSFVVVRETVKQLKHVRPPIITKSAKKAAIKKAVAKPAAAPAKK